MMKVFPVSFGFYGANCSGRNAMFFGYLSVWPRVVEYLKSASLGKFGPVAQFAISLPAVSNRVGVVFPCRSPSKVFFAVIPWVAVTMKANLSVLWRASKGSQNKLMGGKHLPFAILPKLKKRATSFSAARLSQNSDSPYPSKVRNLVKTLITNNWLPCFHTGNTIK